MISAQHICQLIPWLLVALLAASGGAQSIAAAQHACRATPLSLSTVQPLERREGRLSDADPSCLSVRLERGDFVRITIQADGVVIRAFAPDIRQPILRTHPPSVAFIATTPGTYLIEISTEARSAQPRPWTARLDEYRSAAGQDEHMRELRTDPRSRWFRENARPISAGGAEDSDYADLAFLRHELRSVRVIMLGESDHGNGSDLRTKTRLIKFLHQELGFDVLAFESSLFGMSTAWEALRRGVDPRSAFRLGAYRVWALSEQVQPLLEYVGAAAQSARPLELAGFDNQFTGTADFDSLYERLRDFLRRVSIPSPLVDSASTPARALQAFMARRSPTDSEWDELKIALRAAAAECDRMGSRDSRLWGQIMKSVANPGGRIRDRQMADNLLYLIEHHYAGRKVIVWAHNTHIMRNPEQTNFGRATGFSMGHGIWQKLGAEVFAVGFTSYQGTSHNAHHPGEQWRTIIADQHAETEFEEYLNLAGYERAWLPFRTLPGGAWLRSPFLARIDGHITERAPWADMFDALIFVNNQEPSRTVPGAIR